MNPLNFLSRFFGAVTRAGTAAGTSGTSDAAILTRLERCQQAADDAADKARQDLAAAGAQLAQKQKARADAVHRVDRLNARIVALEDDSRQRTADLSRQVEAASATYARGVASNDSAVEAAGAERLAELRQKQSNDADAAQLAALRREVGEASRSMAQLDDELKAIAMQQVRAQLAAAWADHDMALNAPTLTGMRLMRIYLDNGLLPPQELQALHLIWASADRAVVGEVTGVSRATPTIDATGLRAAARHFAPTTSPTRAPGNESVDAPAAAA